jgi:hypothetical protein
VPPKGFRVISGAKSGFSLHSMGRTRRVFELEIPGGARGTHPISLRADLGGTVIEHTAYLAIKD